jgi:ketosteroid isomerase-like protein
MEEVAAGVWRGEGQRRQLNTGYSEEMSGDNVELVRPIYEAFNQRDWDALFRDMDPEFAFNYHNVDTAAGTRRGRGEVIAFYDEYGSVFDTLRWEPEEFIDHGDRIVVILCTRSRPPGGRIDFMAPTGHVWTVRDGVVLSLESYVDPARALEAVELSEDHVEIVRRAFAYEVYEGGDRAEAEAIFDPDVEYSPVEEEPLHGVDAIRENFRRWRDAWQELEVAVEEVVDAGDRVLLTAHYRGRGRASGVEIDTRFYSVYTLRGGKVVREDEYGKRAEALEAAGLSE